MHENELILEYQKNPTPGNEQKLFDAHKGYISANINKWKGTLPDIVLDTYGKQYAVDAFKSFDPSKNASINTHLYNNISRLSRLVYQHNNIVNIPENQIRQIGLVDSAKNYLTDELNREPTTKEISQHLNLPESHIEKIIKNNRADLLYDSDIDIKDTQVNSTSPLYNRLVSLRYTLPVKEKRQLEDLIGFEKDPLSLKEFGKKYKMKPYEISRLKAHFAKKIED